MALPTRRRDASQLAEPARPPTTWEPPTPLGWDGEPLAQVRELNRRVARLLDELVGDWPGIPASSMEGISGPLGDLEELDDAWLLRVELPGVKRDDVDIQLAGRRLLVRAERKQTERKGLLRRSTRTSGRYFLEVVLPGEVDPDGVDATLEDGVLTIRLAKPEAEQRRTRKIAIR